MGLEDQDVVPHGAIPNLFFRIPEKYVYELMKGNEAMGGPIDWIYVGPSDVSGEVVDGKLNLNGNFYTVEEFVKKTGGADQFFFRIRKRDLDGEMTEIDFSDVDPTQFVQLIPSVTVENLADALEQTSKWMTEGYEGSILKDVSNKKYGSMVPVQCIWYFVCILVYVFYSLASQEKVSRARRRGL